MPGLAVRRHATASLAALTGSSLDDLASWLRLEDRWLFRERIDTPTRLRGGLLYDDELCQSWPLYPLAQELVRLNVNVIATAATPAAKAAQKATSTIPIVMIDPGDPVETGLVASLARPGGNITGQSSMAPDLAGKRLQLLKEIAPSVSRVAILFYGIPRSRRPRWH